MIVYIYFAIYNILQPTGLLLQKLGLKQVGEINLSSPASIFRALTNPLVFSGVALMAVGLILWLTVLSRFNLSYIQPFGAIVYIVIALLSFFFLHEAISFTRWLGIIVIVVGAFLLNLG